MKTNEVKTKCPKCGGKLFLFNDYEGWYEQCLNCSFILYLDVVCKGKKIIEVRKTKEDIEKEPVALSGN